MRNKMKKWLLSVLALLFCMSFSVSATGTTLVRSEKGSITVTLADSSGNTVSGGAITIYQVATLSLKNGSLVYTYTGDFTGCTVTLDVSDSNNSSLAAALAAYVESVGISGTEQTVGSNGTVTFKNLDVGLYLLVQTTASGSYKTISPFVVTVPYEDNGAFVYDVDASLKVGTVTRNRPNKPNKPGEPDDPDDPPETTTTTTTVTVTYILPQTGQLFWLVPVLAVCGLLLFALGWVLQHPGREEEDV
ncbi:MAG: hypothetical protein LUE31_12225 [Lachnospiraceae bacterium]|nr:hypothetical protein [Lachnospiraceae bacterium]